MKTELQKICDLQNKREEIAKQICAATKEAFPIGTLLTVHLGRGPVTGRVEWVGDSYWSSPGEIAIRNIETGKRRRFRVQFKSECLTVIRKGPEDHEPIRVSCEWVCPTCHQMETDELARDTHECDSELFSQNPKQ